MVHPGEPMSLLGLLIEDRGVADPKETAVNKFHLVRMMTSGIGGPVSLNPL